MTQTIKPIRTMPFTGRALSDGELDVVAGSGANAGTHMLSSAVNNTIKTIGAALQSAARGG